MAATTPKIPAKGGMTAFSHLARTPGAARAEDNDDDKDKKDKDKAEQDEEDKKKAEQDEEDKKKAEQDEEDKKKAEQDEKDKDKAADDEDDTSAKVAGDNESDKAEANDVKVSAARARERGRIAAIVNSEAGRANMVAATHFALATSMPREEVIATLKAIGPSAAAPAPKSNALKERMDRQPNPDVGADNGKSAQPNLAAQIIAAGNKRRGEVPAK